MKAGVEPSPPRQGQPGGGGEVGGVNVCIVTCNQMNEMNRQLIYFLCLLNVSWELTVMSSATLGIPCVSWLLVVTDCD